jgi:uncharacterized protein
VGIKKVKLLTITKLLGVVFILSTIFVWYVGSYLSKPVNQTISMPAEFEKIIFNGTHGSYLKSENTKICALLMHGVRSNRTSLINRSKFLHELGISSLLIDLQAHGETPGDIITFGIKESIDARNGVDYLRNIKSCQKIFAIGQSLGGASALLGNGPINVDALILESVFPTIEDAVRNRIEARIGAIGKIAAPLLYWQIPLRTTASLSDLKPINVLPKLSIPVFIISGSIDKHTTAEETIRMFNAAKEPKQLWIVEGAAHQDLFAFNQKLYKEKIMKFIQDYLQQ